MWTHGGRRRRGRRVTLMWTSEPARREAAFVHPLTGDRPSTSPTRVLLGVTRNTERTRRAEQSLTADRFRSVGSQIAGIIFIKGADQERASVLRWVMYLRGKKQRSILAALSGSLAAGIPQSGSNPARFHPLPDPSCSFSSTANAVKSKEAEYNEDNAV
ncbi:hypothetical protein MHYP_G00090300 [Metynnis hypsauchen]